MTGHAGRVYGVAISSQGVLASGGDDRTVRLWDTATRRPIGQPLRTDASVLDVAFSADGTRLAAAGADGAITLWTADGSFLGRLTGHAGPVHAVAFGSGSILASAGEDGAWRLWDVSTRQPVGEPVRGTEAVQAVTFSPDGSLVATAGADAAIRIWDVATRAPHGNPVTGFRSWINDIAFTPDGHTIAAAADEGLRLWDVDTGRPRGASLQEGRRSFSVAIAPGGDQVAGATENSTTVWDLRPDVLTAQACDIANRNLSRSEWERFMPATTPQSTTCPQQ